MDQNLGITSKLENIFLAMLRIVILVVLSVSLIGAIYLGVTGAINLNATQKVFKQQQQPNISEMAKKFKESLNDRSKDEAPAEDKPKEKTPSKANLLENEILKQIKIISTFLKIYGRDLTDQEKFKEWSKDNAQKWALDPDSESSTLAYAKGQTDFFKAIFEDKNIIDFFKKQDDEYFGQKFSDALSVYPDYFDKQRDEKIKFDAAENEAVIQKKSDAMVKIYISAGLFGVFLLISLVLALVKIERNLRSKIIT